MKICSTSHNSHGPRISHMPSGFDLTNSRFRTRLTQHLSSLFTRPASHRTDNPLPLYRTHTTSNLSTPRYNPDTRTATTKESSPDKLHTTQLPPIGFPDTSNDRKSQCRISRQDLQSPTIYAPICQRLLCSLLPYFSIRKPARDAQCRVMNMTRTSGLFSRQLGSCLRTIPCGNSRNAAPDHSAVPRIVYDGLHLNNRSKILHNVVSTPIMFIRANVILVDPDALHYISDHESKSSPTAHLGRLHSVGIQLLTHHNPCNRRAGALATSDPHAASQSELRELLLSLVTLECIHATVRKSPPASHSSLTSATLATNTHANSPSHAFLPVTLLLQCLYQTSNSLVNTAQYPCPPDCAHNQSVA